MMYSRRTERAAFVDAAQWPKWPEIHCQALAKLMMSTRERHEKQKSLLILLLLAWTKTSQNPNAKKRKHCWSRIRFWFFSRFVEVVSTARCTRIKTKRPKSRGNDWMVSSCFNHKSEYVEEDEVWWSMQFLCLCREPQTLPCPEDSCQWQQRTFDVNLGSLSCLARVNDSGNISHAACQSSDSHVVYTECSSSTAVGVKPLILLKNSCDIWWFWELLSHKATGGSEGQCSLWRWIFTSSPRPPACLAAGLLECFALGTCVPVKSESRYSMNKERSARIRDWDDMCCKHMVSLCLFAKCNAHIAVSANQWCHVRRHDSWAVCTAGQFPRSAQVCILSEESGSVCLPNDWSASRLCSQDLGSASTFCLEKVAGTNDDICWVWRVADDEHLSICYWKNFKEIILQLRSASCWVSPTSPMEFLICSNYLIPLVIICYQ